jgi:acetyl-CoA carboxylase biotin carboxyl carrier protein
MSAMRRPPLELLVIERDDGVSVLAAPAPGRVRLSARRGETLVAGSRAGTLVRNARAFDLVLPAGVHGQLREILVRDPLAPCSYAMPLAVLGAVEAAPLGHLAAHADTQDGWVVRAPSHGTFYLRPAPGQPPYAAPGQDVARGAVLGLVEVMKCFSPILFDPPGAASSGRVTEVLVHDGAEVRAEQPLVRLALQP